MDIFAQTPVKWTFLGKIRVNPKSLMAALNIGDTRASILQVDQMCKIIKNVNQIRGAYIPFCCKTVMTLPLQKLVRPIFVSI